MIAIDARGMRCPWPALRLARALRDGADAVALRADDPGAPAEIARVVADADAVLRVEGAGGNAVFFVTRGTCGNGVFTQSP